MNCYTCVCVSVFVCVSLSLSLSLSPPPWGAMAGGFSGGQWEKVATGSWVLKGGVATMPALVNACSVESARARERASTMHHNRA